MKLSSISAKVLAASLVLVSTTGLAFAKGYKGENYKGEAMAAPCPAPVTLKDGFYVGAQVGYDNYNVQTRFSTPAVTGTPTVSATGWVGGLLLGYGQYFNTFYLAGEIFANATGAQQSYTVTGTAPATYSNTFQVRGQYGISLLPGLKLNDTTLGYIRLGANWASLRSTDGTNLVANRTVTNTKAGFNYGLGLETLVYDNWSVRAEMSHTTYSSFTNNVNTPTTVSDNLRNPQDNQMMLALIYHFA